MNISTQWNILNWFSEHIWNQDFYLNSFSWSNDQLKVFRVVGECWNESFQWKTDIREMKLDIGQFSGFCRVTVRPSLLRKWRRWKNGGHIFKHLLKYKDASKDNFHIGHIVTCSDIFIFEGTTNCGHQFLIAGYSCSLIVAKRFFWIISWLFQLKQTKISAEYLVMTLGSA